MGGSAILAAADNLRAAVRAEVARRLNCGSSEVEIVEGEKAVGPGGKTIPLRGLWSKGFRRKGSS